MSGYATINRWPGRHSSWHGDQALKERVVAVARDLQGRNAEMLYYPSTFRPDREAPIMTVLQTLGVSLDQETDRHWRYWNMREQAIVSREAAFIGVPDWFIEIVNFNAHSLTYEVSRQTAWGAVVSLLEALPVQVDIGQLHARHSIRIIQDRLIPALSKTMTPGDRQHRKEMFDVLNVYCDALTEGQVAEETLREIYANVICAARDRYQFKDGSADVWLLLLQASYSIVWMNEDRFDQNISGAYVSAVETLTRGEDPVVELGRNLEMFTRELTNVS